ncbi:MAG: hypothetical protein LBD88_01095 [Candidatus Peribacteria bacterium]|nr:hypothetical protein [Candidatus Peribacteria bacterium]
MLQSYKKEIENIRTSIDIKGTHILEETFKLKKEILKKQEEELKKDLGKLLEEVIKIEEQRKIKIVFF